MSELVPTESRTVASRVVLNGDSKVMEVKADLPKLQEQVKALVVTDEASKTKGDELIAWIAKNKKALKERQAFYLLPLKNEKAEIDDYFNPAIKGLEAVDTVARDKVVAFLHAEDARRLAAETEARKKQEAAERKARQTGRAVPPPPPPAPVAPVLPKTNHTEFGSTTAKRPWTFEVLDAAKVPASFKIVDDKAVREAIRNGVRDIPGIRIYQDIQLSAR